MMLRFFRVVVNVVLCPPCGAEPSARVSLSCGCSRRCASPNPALVQLRVGVPGERRPRRGQEQWVAGARTSQAQESTPVTRAGKSTPGK